MVRINSFMQRSARKPSNSSCIRATLGLLFVNFNIMELAFDGYLAANRRL